ncbi:MAG: tetratricopeptide repeat protein [Coriobacteriia bacterium]|nr:tetratricopeptide repeat protein [Coriobacteriia bacterium]
MVAPSGAAEVHSTDAAVPPENLIPGWLALLVLILLLAVAALGGYLIRGALVEPTVSTPTELAVDQYEEEVEKDPNDPESMLALGYAYQQEGRYEEALEMYESVLALDATNTGALYNKGMVFMALDRTKEAEVVLWDVLEVAPDHALAAKALGEYYVGKQQYKSALMTLEPVIELRPQYADLQYLAGYSCEQLGINDVAIRYYRGALTYNPDYTEARDGLARLGVAE